MKKNVKTFFTITLLFSQSFFAQERLTVSEVVPNSLQETSATGETVTDTRASDSSIGATDTTDTGASGISNIESATNATNATSTSDVAATSSEGEQSSVDETSSSQDASTEDASELYDYPEFSEVPPAKRPQKPDSEKVKKAETKDIGKTSVQDKKDSIKYGIESDILSLLDELKKNDDPRFVEEIYDLFSQTKSKKVRSAILDYFAKLEDPCLEDYAVTILNDPFDENADLVNSVFKYTAAVKCKDAINAVMTLLKNDNEKYFDNSLTTIGEIGGEKEAAVIAEYLDREDLSLSQKQTLMKVLGKIKALSTWEKLTQIIENEDENVFVRSYAAQAIGAMKKVESIPILKDLYESLDPTIRTYALKGLAFFEKEQVQDTFIEAVKDSHYKVRLEAISAVESLKITEAIPYLIYRAKHDSEASVKKACYPVIAKLDTSDGNDFLLSLITDKKYGETTKSLVVTAIMQNQKRLPKEITILTEEILKDDTKKSLRYSVGKQFVETANADYLSSEYSNICKQYLQSKDVSTQGIGLDLYIVGRYGSCDELVREIANAEKKSVNRTKARKILNMDDE